VWRQHLLSQDEPECSDRNTCAQLNDAACPEKYYQNLPSMHSVEGTPVMFYLNVRDRAPEPSRADFYCMGLVLH
jgi:hypothetical protein